MIKPKVSVVDYGVGNLFSVCQAIEHSGGSPIVTSDPIVVLASDRVILPGVGAFGKAIEELRDRGLSDAVVAFAETGRPLLGLCVGMQMLFDASEEFGYQTGLGLIPGRVTSVASIGVNGERHKIPHVGWAPLELRKGESAPPLFSSVKNGDSVYFLHSFSVNPVDPNHCTAVVYYDGVVIVAAVQSNNIFGIQFHPEKSATIGLQILSNFVKY